MSGHLALNLGGMIYINGIQISSKSSVQSQIIQAFMLRDFSVPTSLLYINLLRSVKDLRFYNTFDIS